MLRILIADEDGIVRRALRALIEANPGWQVCGEAADGADALEIALRERPDIVILDADLPVLNGVTVARRLSEDLRQAGILMLARKEDPDALKMTLGAGVRGYLLKSDSDQHLVPAIDELSRRRPYFSPFVTEFILNAAVNGRRKSSLEHFTARELEVAQLVAEGKSNSLIARHLNISVKTVESHRAAAMRKAGVHSGPEFVRFAIKHNIIRA